jgi:hypothetical protein
LLINDISYTYLQIFKHFIFSNDANFLAPTTTLQVSHITICNEQGLPLGMNLYPVKRWAVFSKSEVMVMWINLSF